MKRKPTTSIAATPLRHRAEVRLRERSENNPSVAGVTRSTADTQRLVHELQVHQIELEMQNEELLKARDEMEAGLEQYSDLYDFAPVGYFTLTPDGTIRLVNLTGATLVGIERSRLVGQSFGRLVTTELRPAFNSFLKAVFAGQTKQSSEFALLRQGRPHGFVNIEAQGSPNGQDCRAVVIDITARKRASAQVELLWEAAEVLLSTDDPETILHGLFAKLGPALGVDTYFNYMVDETGSALRLASFAGISAETARSINRLEFGQAISGTVALHREPIHATQLLQSADPKVQLARSFGLRVCACNPLMSGKLLLGTLSYASRSRQKFDPDELAVLRTISHYVAVAHGRLRAANSLQTSEERYRRLFEAAKDGILILDPVTRKITDANPFIVRLLGYSRKQLIKKELWQIGLLKDEAANQKAFRELKAKGFIRYEDLPLKSKGGEHHEVEFVSNLYDENGAEVIQCNIRDITERKQAEKALIASEERFRALFDLGPVGVYSCDATGVIQEFNRTAEILWGRKPKPRGTGEWFCGSHKLYRPDGTLLPHTQCPMAAVLHGKIPAARDMEVLIERPDGSRITVIVNIVPLRGGGEITGAINCFYDITERKQAEDALRTARAQLIAYAAQLEGLVAKRTAALSATNQRLVASVDSIRKSKEQYQALHLESQGMQKKLRHLTHQIITAQEDERKEISRELHDDVVQTLIGINVELAALSNGSTIEVHHLKEKIALTQRLVENSVNSVHQFARELRPAVLDDLGLIPALHAFSKSLAARKKFSIQLTAFGGVEALGGAKRTVLFRVAQEALNNVARHANATQARLSISKISGAVRMEISDNGKSFQVRKTLLAKNNKRLGLIGMKERIEMVGGNLTIESVSGKGTTVRADIPFNQEQTKL